MNCIRPHGSLSLLELVRRILDHSDREALEELHNHRYNFRLAEEGPALTLDEYLVGLHKRLASFDEDTSEEAYYLTFCKFYLLPDHTAPNQQATAIHCHPQFRAFYAYMTKAITSHPEWDTLTLDTQAGRALQNQIKWHFRLSILECRRRHSYWSGYVWHVADGFIPLRMPRCLRGKERSQWLTENVPDADPHRPQESERIQQLIHRYFGAQGEVGLDEGHEIAGGNENGGLEEYERLYGGTAWDLMEYIAKEKASLIGLLPPSIKKLGKEKVYQLVMTILERIFYEQYNQKKIAQEFSIDPASFNRFAGEAWKKSETPDIPYLWKNVARVLMQFPALQEAVQIVGMGPAIELCLVNEKSGEKK